MVECTGFALVMLQVGLVDFRLLTLQVRLLDTNSLELGETLCYAFRCALLSCRVTYLFGRPLLKHP